MTKNDEFIMKKTVKKINWQIKKLGDVCEIVNGGTPKTNIGKYWDGDVLWITPKDMGKVQSFYADHTLRKISKQGLENSSAKLIPKDSVILSTRAPIGHLVINSEEMSFNQGCKGLITKNNLDTKYLFYFLFNSVDLLNKLGSGTTFKELSGTKLKQIQIPLPSLPEQKRIVKILDGVFGDVKKAKENAEKNLANAKELFENYSSNIYLELQKKYELEILANLAELVRGPFGGSLTKSMFAKNGYAVYEQRNAIGDFTDNFRYFIDKKKFEEMKRFSVKGGGI